MIAFSAAGIWSEANQAHAAVQREANALENVLSVAASFPPALRERVTADFLSSWRTIARSSDGYR